MKEELRAKDSNIEELQAFNVNVAQCMSTGLLTTDDLGRITAFNRAAEEITGFKWEAVRGKRFLDILPVKEIEDILNSIKQILPIYRFESEVNKKDESRIILGMNVSHLLDEGGRSHGLIVIFQDLTKVKEMEREVKEEGEDGYDWRGCSRDGTRDKESTCIAQRFYADFEGRIIPAG